MIEQATGPACLPQHPDRKLAGKLRAKFAEQTG